MRARWVTAAVVAGGLGLPAAAHAGGWATVSLSSTPDGIAPGQPWVVEMDIRQHGVTPLQGVQPSVTVTESGTGTTRTFAARPTDRPGVYVARAVFPAEGRWEYVVHDGFTQSHSYPPVTIGASAAGPPDTGFPWPALAASLAAGLLAAGLTLALQRRRRPHPQPLGSAS